jgi:hypothetical protein
MFPPVDPTRRRFHHRPLARPVHAGGFSLVIAAGAEPFMWLSFQHSLGRLSPPVE